MNITTYAKASLAALVVAALTMADPASAAEKKGKKPNVGKKGTPPTEEVQQIGDLALARQLANYGIAKHDALALIVAAGISKAIPTQPLQGGKDGGSEKVEDSLTVDKLLGQAREFSGGKPEVLAVIDQVAKTEGAAKGAIRGPVQHVDTVRAGRTDSYNITFRGDRVARIGVVGSGTSDIDCFVYDENGNRIDEDDDYTSECDLEWNPAWTGPFRVEVVNNGSRASDYILLTN